MTVTPAVVEEEEVKPTEGFQIPPDITQMGIICAVVGVITLIIPGLPAVVRGIGLIFVLLWGMDSVRKTSKYGLGTGVPSIGVLAMGYGIIGALLGIAFVKFAEPMLGSFSTVASLAGVLLMGIAGLVSGVLSNHEKVIGMKIPGLERGMMELGLAGSLAMLLQFSIVAGSLNFDVVMEKAISNGLIAAMFILSCMAVLHPYNACLGPDERRPRTMLCCVEISGLLCVILGIALVVTATSTWGLIDGVSMTIFGAIVWLVFFVKFVRMSMDEAYSTIGTGMIKTIE